MVGVKKWPGFLLCASIVSAASNLPVVDLGYERHRAIAYNVSLSGTDAIRSYLDEMSLTQ